MSDAATFYEYGIRYVNDPDSWRPHREGMTEEEARDWATETNDEIGKPVFVVVRREVGEWEVAP